MNLAEIKGFKKTEYQNKQRDHHDAVRKFNSGLSDMFDDMLMHVSAESKLLIERDAPAYITACDERDPVKLLKLIRTSHTLKGTVVKPTEIRDAKARMEAVRQIKPDGSTISLEAYNKMWNEQLKDATAIGATWTEPELAELYLNSVDNRLIRSELNALLRDQDMIPQTVVEAQIWVLDMITDLTRLAEQDQESENFSKRKYAQPAQAVDIDKINSTPADKDCSFCHTRHRGGPDACFHYKQYVRDNQKAINAFVDKRKKSRNTQSPNPKRQDRKPQPTKGNNPKQSSTPKENGKKGAKKFGNAHVMLSQLR